MIALISLCLMASGCASVPDCEPVFSTVVEYRDRLVPVASELTEPQAPPDVEVVTWLDAVIIGIHYRQKWESAEYKLSVIRETHGDTTQ